MKLLKIPVTLWLSMATLLAGMSVKAQVKMNKFKQDSTINRISNHLGISKEKAGQMFSAMDYHREDIKKVLQDTTISAEVKNNEFKRLVRERQHFIDSLISPVQKQKLRQLDPDTLKMQYSLRLMRQRHELQMNRIPYQRPSRASKADTVNLKSN